MKQPTLTYRMAFLIGGVAFAGISYAIGTWLYELEDRFAQSLPLVLDYGESIRRIPAVHPITFFPWIVGTTILSIALGYLFDKQIKYLRRSEELQKRAELLAVIDGLTQLYNHSYFIEQLSLEIKRSQRRVANIALLMTDLDGFKNYNDTYGHLAGDELLKRVARTIKVTVRETDIVARYGGEEFVVIAQGAIKEQAIVLAERIRQGIQLSTPITVSVGVAAYPEDGMTVEELIERADEAMYFAKRDGKNKVYVAESGSKPHPATSIERIEAI